MANFNYFELLVQTIAQQLSQLIVRNDSTLLNLSQRHSIMVFPCDALSLGRFQLARKSLITLLPNTRIRGVNPYGLPKLG